MIIPSQSLEVKSNPFTDSVEQGKEQPKPSIWTRMTHVFFN